MERNEMESIYDKFKNTVFRTAFAYCKNYAEAEDVTSDVFVKCFTSEKKFEDDNHLKAWLIRVTINRCKDIFKSFRFKNLVSLDDAQKLTYEAPEENEVYNAVMSLPKKYRTVIHLFYYEQYSTREIAQITQRSDTAVRTQLCRGRDILKKKLRKEFQI
ncbi:sigma-70 family RNA polymerase sigma factor [Porcipelethomonas sp.]|uniref:sigma-70 family RNA polymerase sigma factor n=1 Tax=Porcipelethomonas sp. TaxID=2981675 RepID=UPI003EF940C2